MTIINCDVTNCSHNKNKICYANRVNISGKTAADKSGTCCGSFLNKLLYSELTNTVNNSDNANCDCLVCYTTSCKNNINHLCSLDEVNVGGGSDVAIYIETSCKSFEKNN